MLDELHKGNKELSTEMLQKFKKAIQNQNIFGVLMENFLLKSVL